MARQDESGKDDLVPNFTPAKREAQDRPKGRVAESPVDDQHVDAPKQSANAHRHRSDIAHDRRDLLHEQATRKSKRTE